MEPSMSAGDETSSLMSSSSGRRTNQPVLTNSTLHLNSPTAFSSEKVGHVDGLSRLPDPQNLITNCIIGHLKLDQRFIRLCSFSEC